MPPIKANIHREIVGKVNSITVSLSNTGKFYASILVDDEVEAPSPIHTISKVTGIDLGLSHFAIESNGTKIWQSKTLGKVKSCPVLGVDGILYVGSRDNKLYAIETKSRGLAKSPWPMRGQNPQHTGKAISPK